MGRDRTRLSYHGWQALIETEREQLAERARGNVVLIIGRALQSESQQELDLFASEDQYLAEQRLPLPAGVRDAAAFAKARGVDD